MPTQGSLHHPMPGAALDGLHSRDSSDHATLHNLLPNLSSLEAVVLELSKRCSE